MENKELFKRSGIYLLISFLTVWVFNLVFTGNWTFMDYTPEFKGIIIFIILFAAILIGIVDSDI